MVAVAWKTIGNWTLQICRNKHPIDAATLLCRRLDTQWCRFRQRNSGLVRPCRPDVLRAVHSMSKQRRVGRGDGPMLLALGDMERDAPPDNERYISLDQLPCGLESNHRLTAHYKLISSSFDWHLKPHFLFFHL
jgi:hypothetical protein